MAMFEGLRRLFSSSKSDLRRALALIEAGERPAAFKLLAGAAKKGLPEAEYQIARSYLEGAGVPPSAIEGLRWLERSAEQGFLAAQALLAAFYVQGVPISGPDKATDDLGKTVSASLFSNFIETAKPDFEKAAFWARKAADGGSAEAQALLGYLLISGPEAMRDEAESIRLYQLSAAAKCAQGQLGYGLALLRQQKSPEDQQAAAAELTLAAEAGLGTAQYVLGLLTEQGQGVTADLPAAIDLFRKAAEQGVRSAQARYGMALLKGTGVEADPVIAESWLRRAAIQGDPESAATVGQLYAKGGALPANLTEAAIMSPFSAWARNQAAVSALSAAEALPWVTSMAMS